MVRFEVDEVEVKLQIIPEKVETKNIKEEKSTYYSFLKENENITYPYF